MVVVRVNWLVFPPSNLDLFLSLVLGDSELGAAVVVVVVVVLLSGMFL